MRRTRTRRAAMLTAAALVASAVAAVPGSAQMLPNLAPNAGFEDALGSTYHSHGPCAFDHATDAAHDGLRSLRIASSDPSSTLCRWLSTISAIPVAPGPFSVGAFLKAQDVGPGVTRLTVTFWDASGTYIPGSAHDIAPALQGTNDWTAVAAT